LIESLSPVYLWLQTMMAPENDKIVVYYIDVLIVQELNFVVLLKPSVTLVLPMKQRIQVKKEMRK